MNKFMLKNRIHDYVDGELSPEERLEMERALTDHPDIQQEIEDTEQLREQMLSMSSVQAPSYLLDNILVEVDQQSISANQPRGQAYMGYALIAVVGLLGWVFIPTSNKVMDTTSTGVGTETVIKGAQVFPTANPVVLPKTSPIEEADKHLDSLQQKLEDTTQPSPTIKSSTASSMERSKTTQAQPKKKRTVKQSKPPTFVIQTPDSPYVPEWEEGHIIEVQDTTFDPDAFQFRTAPSNLLFTLNKLSKSVNGQLKLTNGDEFSPIELTNFSPRATFEMWVPTESVSSINQQLTELGGQFFANSIRQEGGYGIFKIDVRYQYY